MFNNIDVFGEIHNNEDRTRVENIIKVFMPTRNYEYLLLEEAVDNVALTKESIKKLIRTNNTSIGLRGYELALELNLKVIGIDIDVDSNLSLEEQFKNRENNMCAVIGKYINKGNCAVIVGDTHLRTTKTKELGDVSPINLLIKNVNGLLVRAPKEIRELD